MVTTSKLEPEPRLAPVDREVSPRIRGLALFIQEAVAQRRNAFCANNTRCRDDHDGLLFLGHWHGAHPRLLFHDPILEPVDKVVWAILRHHAEAGDVTAFPPYQSLAQLANLGSKATVARALLILRITRWLSLCARVRDEKGRFQGNVYALHDEPLAVADAMYLDPQYLPFLHAMQQHHHDRVKQVATAVLTSITEAIARGSDVTQEAALAQRHERQLAAPGGVEDSGDQDGFAGVSSQPSEALHSADSGPEAGCYRHLESADPDQNLNSVTRVQKVNSVAEDRVQNLNPDTEIPEKQQDSAPVQNLNPVSVGSSSSSSSSSYIKTTTTTTTPAVNSAAAHPRELTGEEFHFPPQLSAEEVVLAKRYLGRLSAGLRQDVLDEWQGRLGNAGRSGQPIHNPIGYLAQLCNAVKTGAFQLTSLGLQVRRAQEQTAARQRAEAHSEQRHLQALLANPPPAGPLIDRILAIRQQAHRRRAEGQSSEPPHPEDREHDPDKGSSP